MAIQEKIDMAIERLKSFEPPEGYYVAFSGGKDSQCVYHLCQMAGVKFDAHYNVTSVDPPELIYFIREHYPDVEFVHPTDSKGEPVTMWSLIRKNKIPPTRVARYCCTYLKESSGKERVTVTGVRWAESARRKAQHGVADIFGKPKTTQKRAEELGVDYRVNKSGSVILNDDNAEERRMVEFCYRTQKTLVNPIVDWEDEDVWEFLNEVVKVPHCCLYDRGWDRIGCIGCPLSQAKGQKRAFEAYPKYRALYVKAFDRMLLEKRRERGLPTEWKDGEDVMRWWIGAQEKPPCSGNA